MVEIVPGLHVDEDESSDGELQSSAGTMNLFDYLEKQQ
jgi:hypothetical protein